MTHFEWHERNTRAPRGQQCCRRSGHLHRPRPRMPIPRALTNSCLPLQMQHFNISSYVNTRGNYNCFVNSVSTARLSVHKNFLKRDEWISKRKQGSSATTLSAVGHFRSTPQNLWSASSHRNRSLTSFFLVLTPCFKNALKQFWDDLVPRFSPSSSKPWASIDSNPQDKIKVQLKRAWDQGKIEQ